MEEKMDLRKRYEDKELLSSSFALYFGLNLCQDKRVYIGIDTRESSLIIKEELTLGLRMNGNDVFDLGVVPTSMVDYLTRINKFDYGIMITASHNPYFYNGFKIFTSKGKLSNEEIEMINCKIHQNKEMPIKEKGNYYYAYEDKKRYIDYLKKRINFSKDISFVLDLANGASYAIAKEVFSDFKGIKFINDSPNGVNINDLCGTTNIYYSLETKVNSGYEFLFAIDGDGDRFLGLDHNNELIDGDKFLFYYLSKYKGEYACSIISNPKLKNIIEYKSYIVPVGDGYLSEKMKEVPSIIIAAEKSGHIIFKDEDIKGDGLLSLIIFLNINMKKPYKEVIKKYQEKYRKDINIFFADDFDKSKINAQINEMNSTNTIIRFSNTEKCIRISCQGEKEEVNNTLLDLVDKIKNILGDSFKCVD